MMFSMKQNFKSKGFTLIELMIVVAIIAVIAAIAFPSYTASIRKARHVDAKQGLTEAALKLENFYARNATYTTDLRQVGYNALIWNNVPLQSPDIYYQIRVLPPNGNCAIANCFRLQSRNRNDQVNDTTILWYRLWSTGRKQHRRSTSEPARNGWK